MFNDTNTAVVQTTMRVLSCEFISTYKHTQKAKLVIFVSVIVVNALSLSLVDFLFAQQFYIHFSFSWNDVDRSQSRCDDDKSTFTQLLPSDRPCQFTNLQSKFIYFLYRVHDYHASWKLRINGGATIAPFAGSQTSSTSVLKTTFHGVNFLGIPLIECFCASQQIPRASEMGTCMPPAEGKI